MVQTDPLVLIARSLEELNSFGKKRCGYANAIDRGTPSIPPDACVCQLDSNQEVADCVQGHITYNKNDGSYQVPTAQESTTIRKQGHNWCPCWASYINNPLPSLGRFSLPFWFDPFQLVSILGMPEGRLADRWGRRGIGAAFDQGTWDIDRIPQASMVSLRRPATIALCKSEGMEGAKTSKQMGESFARRAKESLDEAKIQESAGNMQAVREQRKRAAMYKAQVLSFPNQSLLDFLEEKIGTYPNYASIGSAAADREQVHFPASGAGESGHSPLDPGAEHGLAMCSVHCHCKGLCSGNMQMAAYGCQIAGLWQLARRMLGNAIGRQGDSPMSDSDDDMSPPGTSAQLRALDLRLSSALMLYEEESTRVPMFALAQVILAGQQSDKREEIFRRLKEILRGWESDLFDLGDEDEVDRPNLRSVVHKCTRSSIRQVTRWRYWPKRDGEA